MLTDDQWEMFYTLLEKIVNDRRPVFEKEIEVLRKANEYSAATELEEFVSWDFTEDV